MNPYFSRPKRALSGTIEGPTTAATIPVAEVKREAEQVEQEEMQKEAEMKTPEKKPREHAEDEEEEEEDEVVQESPQPSRHTPESEQKKPALADIDITNFVVNTKVGPVSHFLFKIIFLLKNDRTSQKRDPCCRKMCHIERGNIECYPLLEKTHYFFCSTDRIAFVGSPKRIVAKFRMNAILSIK